MCRLEFPCFVESGQSDLGAFSLRAMRLAYGMYACIVGCTQSQVQQQLLGELGQGLCCTYPWLTWRA